MGGSCGLQREALGGEEVRGCVHASKRKGLDTSLAWTPPAVFGPAPHLPSKQGLPSLAPLLVLAGEVAQRPTAPTRGQTDA